MNRHQKPELWTGFLESLDTMMDGPFPIAELDLALLQMSEGTQGARMLTLHPRFRETLVATSPCQRQACDLIQPAHVWFRYLLTVEPFHPKPLLPATADHVLDRGVVGAGL